MWLWVLALACAPEEEIDIQPEELCAFVKRDGGYATAEYRSDGAAILFENFDRDGGLSTTYEYSYMGPTDWRLNQSIYTNYGLETPEISVWDYAWSVDQDGNDIAEVVGGDGYRESRVVRPDGKVLSVTTYQTNSDDISSIVETTYENESSWKTKTIIRRVLDSTGALSVEESTEFFWDGLTATVTTNGDEPDREEYTYRADGQPLDVITYSGGDIAGHWQYTYRSDESWQILFRKSLTGASPMTYSWTVCPFE